jgi:hypothetical protein
MRFLYGDSVPFPLEYDFLATLEAFVSCAARVVGLEAELTRAQAAAAEISQDRLRRFDELEAFHQGVMRAIEEPTTPRGHVATLLPEYIRQLSSCATRAVQEAQRGATEQSDRERAQLAEENRRRRQEMRVSLETFLRQVQLPGFEPHFSLHLEGGRNQLSVVFSHPVGVVLSFLLDASRVTGWQKPRKVGEFATGLDLQVGLKKGWMTRSAKAQRVHLDDHFISLVDLSRDALELRLRRKVDQIDTLVLTLRYEGESLSAEVLRLQEREDVPWVVDGSDLVCLEQLWHRLESALAEVRPHKERLIAAELEGHDIFESSLEATFIRRLIDLMTPLVTEIHARSPNTNELSLKIEDDAGRREERYLLKSALTRPLESLGQNERALFAPLGLVRAPSSVDIALEE